MVFMGGVASPWADTKPVLVDWIEFAKSIGVIRAGEVQWICTIERSFRWYYNNRLLLQNLEKANSSLQPRRFHCPF